MVGINAQNLKVDDGGGNGNVLNMNNDNMYFIVIEIGIDNIIIFQLESCSFGHKIVCALLERRDEDFLLMGVWGKLAVIKIYWCRDGFV